MSSNKEEMVNLQSLDSPKNGKGDPESSPVNASSEEDYNPHMHRQLAHATTNAETLVHLLKGSLGTGIMAMPQAFFNAGLISGTINTILIGVLCTYCLHVLVRSQYELCKRKRVPVLTYPESMKMALEVGPTCFRRFAPAAPIIIDVFMIVYQLGICCVYIVFVANNIKQICDAYMPELDIKLHMCILFLPLIGINCIRNLKLLAPFSTFANVITFVGMALILVYVLQDMKPVSELDMVGYLRNFPLFFGTTLFALEAVGVIIALENNMKTPASFGGYFGVLNIGMSVIIVLYVLMGALGYMRYGGDSKDSITLNLPQDEIMSQVVKVIFAIAIFISYGLQCYVPVELIWNTYIKKRVEGSEYKLVYEYILRVALVLATFILAIAIPRLSLFISLFGALCLSAMGIAFPAIMELCVAWPDKFGPYKWLLIKDVLLILFGLIGLVAGTYTSLVDIVKSFM
ncbi:proton-coupled amino acid transporter-like protein acs [Arctopsyche grandis]|uniref:proton-coupled amino acid transporter-like protein acs n=1 Tax=Arctopsyche grandis TaxID=121162 RepID=UPI00406D98F9